MILTGTEELREGLELAVRWDVSTGYASVELREHGVPVWSNECRPAELAEVLSDGRWAGTYEEASR